MKKIISLLLTAVIAFSAITFKSVSASAAVTDNIAFKAGSRIYFDNTETQWDEIYFYAWNYGYYVDFVPMEAVEGYENLYSVVVPVDVPAYVEVDGVNIPTEYFLFTNSTTWSGQQTANMPVEAGINTYTPVKTDGDFTFNANGFIASVDLSYTDIPAQTEVLATPYSKDFTDPIIVGVYAFNLPEGVTATYKLNDAEPVEFTDSYSFNITETTTVTVAAGDISKTYTYTKKSYAVITAYAENFTGDIYVYTFGGDRIWPSFNSMQNLGDGLYTYVINGSARVIFTTTADWNTARKFTIRDMDGNVLPDQEPLVSAGEEVTYALTL